jgi:mono/diheme cytochrome c family protein
MNRPGAPIFAGLSLAWVCLTAGYVGASEAGPAEHFVLHCSGCHGLDARGVPGTTPSLHALDRLLELPGGRAYLAAVPGVAQAPLDDASLATLLNWIVARYGTVSQPAGYTAEEVARLRARPIRDPHGARAKLEASMDTAP